MAMNASSSLVTSLEIDPHPQMRLNTILRTNRTKNTLIVFSSESQDPPTYPWNNTKLYLKWLRLLTFTLPLPPVSLSRYVQSLISRFTLKLGVFYYWKSNERRIFIACTMNGFPDQPTWMWQTFRSDRQLDRHMPIKRQYFKSMYVYIYISI